MISRWTALVLMAAAMLAAPQSLSAQARPMAKKGKMAKGALKADLMIQRLQRMTPAERRRFLSQLPPERRRNIERRLQALREMTPEERRRAARALEDFRSLPPDRQMRVRRLFARLGEWPEERRLLLTDEVRALRDLAPDERRERMAGDEYREKYSPLERRWLFEMNSALHDP